MAYLQKLAKHLQFESVLTCVSLPRLTIAASPMDQDEIEGKKSPTQPILSGMHDSRPPTLVAGQSKAKGLSDLVAIFQWLRDNHVRKINKVVVIDDGDPCHSDESIERALTGFDVEVWDWKRLDICSEVIYNCAPNVREISLYWSGNHATLLGWYSNQGFPNKKFNNVSQSCLEYILRQDSQSLPIVREDYSLLQKSKHLEPGSLRNH
jgi:hypothetical protein